MVVLVELLLRVEVRSANAAVELVRVCHGASELSHAAFAASCVPLRHDECPLMSLTPLMLELHMKNEKRASDRAKNAPRSSKRVTEKRPEPKGKSGPWGRLHFGAAGSGGAENEAIPPKKRSR